MADPIQNNNADATLAQMFSTDNLAGILAEQVNVTQSNTDAVIELVAEIKQLQSQIPTILSKQAREGKTANEANAKTDSIVSNAALKGLSPMLDRLKSAEATQLKSGVRNDTEVNRKFDDLRDSIVKLTDVLDKKDTFKDSFGILSSFLSSNNKAQFLNAYGNKWASQLGSGAASKVAGMVGGGVLGSAAGFAAGGAVFLGIKALSGVISQAVKLVGENLSYGVLAGNYVNARKGEALLGNYSVGDSRQFKFGGYQHYRNQMRLMGVRDEEQIASNIIGMFRQGIAGGVGRGDAVSGALSRQAARSVFGIDVSDDTMATLYRSTRGNAGNFMTENGFFSIDRLMKKFASSVQQTTNAFGAQTGLQELFSIFDNLKDNFRGMNNNLEGFVDNLSVLGSLMSNNVIKQREAEQLLSVSHVSSDDAQFQMLALAGVPGNKLLEEKMNFVRAGTSAEGSYENLQVMAQSIVNFAKMAGGSEAQQDTFVREKLREFGYSNLATSLANPVDTFQSILDGDKNTAAEVKDAMQSDSERLRDVASSLDAIKEPVSHIRDLLFSKYEDNFEVLESKMAAGGLLASKLALKLAGGTDEQVKNYGDYVKTQQEKDSAYLQKAASAITDMLEEIRNNTAESNVITKNSIREGMSQMSRTVDTIGK